eukprot:355903-Chlamydomonas_euryale.AAC.10
MLIHTRHSYTYETRYHVQDTVGEALSTQVAARSEPLTGRTQQHSHLCLHYSVGWKGSSCGKYEQSSAVDPLSPPPCTDHPTACYQMRLTMLYRRMCVCTNEQACMIDLQVGREWADPA